MKRRTGNPPSPRTPSRPHPWPRSCTLRVRDGNISPCVPRVHAGDVRRRHGQLCRVPQRDRNQLHVDCDAGRVDGDRVAPCTGQRHPDRVPVGILASQRGDQRKVTPCLSLNELCPGANRAGTAENRVIVGVSTASVASVMPPVPVMPPVLLMPPVPVMSPVPLMLARARGSSRVLDAGRTYGARGSARTRPDEQGEHHKQRKHVPDGLFSHGMPLNFLVFSTQLQQLSSHRSDSCKVR